MNRPPRPLLPPRLLALARALFSCLGQRSRRPVGFCLLIPVFVEKCLSERVADGDVRRDANIIQMHALRVEPAPLQRFMPRGPKRANTTACAAIISPLLQVAERLGCSRHARSTRAIFAHASLGAVPGAFFGTCVDVSSNDESVSRRWRRGYKLSTQSRRPVEVLIASTQK